MIGPSDPIEHLDTVETELCLADLATVESQHAKRQRAMKLDKTVEPLAVDTDAESASPVSTR